MTSERSQEEIIAQCEARLRILEREAERRGAEAAKPKCRDCRWVLDRNRGVFMKCREPLIVGFGDPVYAYDADAGGRRLCSLCGPEKALWQPRRSLIEIVRSALGL